MSIISIYTSPSVKGYEKLFLQLLEFVIFYLNINEKVFLCNSLKFYIEAGSKVCPNRYALQKIDY